MEKENGEGGESAGKPPPDGLLDAAGLFGAYWGRDGAGGAAQAQAQAQAQAALFGFGSRYQAPPGSMGVGHNQGSMPLHPAASAAWWSMASHLAAQDYLARLQASGLNFGGPLADPYSALSALAAKPGKGKQPSRNERSGRSSTSSSASTKEKSPSTSNSQPNMSDWGASYGFPKTSSPSTMHSHSQAMSSLASLNSLASAPHQAKPSKHQPSQSRKSSSSTSSKGKERELALLRGDLMLAQAAAHGAYHAAVAAAAKGKNMSPLYPFGMPGSDKDRHGAIDSLTGLPHTILSAALEGGDPSSVLGGVRLPPDTEIIKYTSSLAGPKAPPGTTNRGRKKTISLDPPQVSVHPSSERPSHSSKRQKVDEYGSRSSVEVIRLPNKPDRAGHRTGSPAPNLADYAGISRELLQTIASQSGVSLAALERQLAGSAAAADSGLNLSTKSNADDSPLDLGARGDDDAPLNLSLKPTPPSAQASDALSRLTSLSSSLNASSSNDRISRRKPGAKPRRVVPELNSQVADSPRPKSSGSEDSESIGWPNREGRPRNLGRGVSKPKKNTVASLLAQSRALGLRPALAQQLLAETDLEKLKALLGEAASTDSECPSDSCPSDSDASESSRRPHDSALRQPLARGWKRITVIKGLSRNCNIKGDVTYTPPEPHQGMKIKTMQELQTFLESNPQSPLTADNFSFSARAVLGEYVQPAPELPEPLLFSEAEINKRLEEARALAALTGPRPTPPPVDRRIELARRQQAARDARRDATSRSRDQARLVRELERNEKAELVKREKEVRSQQLLEHINKNRTQLTIEPLPSLPKPGSDTEWKIPDLVMGPATKTNKERIMPPISLSLIPVPGNKDAQNTPIKLNLDQSGWKDQIEYNALDKMKDYAEKAAFDLPKTKDKSFDFTLMKAHDTKRRRTPDKENSLEKLIDSYSRITEFINGCDWSKLKKKSDDPKSLERKYLDAKNEFMSQNLMLMPKEQSKKTILKEVIDLSEEELTDALTKKLSRGTFNIGKDGELSISVHPFKKDFPAKRRKHEEIERQKTEELAKRQQERELKRHQTMLLKEQQKYITEERERRRQHTTFVRQLDARRRWEERERRKHQNLLDRLLAKEKKLQQRRKEMEILSELRRPQEDSTLADHKSLPTLNRIPGLKLPGQAMADLLQVFEFIHNFGQTLGFDVDAIPSLNTFQCALLPDCGADAEEQLVQVLTQLLVCAIEDPGIPHPGRHTTLLGHALRMGDITPHNLSEVLRIYLYANATGEVKALTGLTAERERERRVADHHQTDAEILATCASTKNGAYYDHLHNNNTYKLSEALRDKPFLALNSTTKAKILAFLCDELLQNKSVLRQLDGSLEHLNQLKKERYLMDMKIRKLRVLHQRKLRAEQAEKQQLLALERMQRLVEDTSSAHRSPHSHDDGKQQLLALERMQRLVEDTSSAHRSPHSHDDGKQQLLALERMQRLVEDTSSAHRSPHSHDDGKQQLLALERMQRLVEDTSSAHRSPHSHDDGKQQLLALERMQRLVEDTSSAHRSPHSHDDGKQQLLALERMQRLVEDTSSAHRSPHSHDDGKQQLLALERMQRLVEDTSSAHRSPHSHDDEHPNSEKDHKDDDREKESTPDIPPSPYKEESDKELSPLKDVPLKSKELMNNNKEECSPPDNKVDKDSVMGDCDAILSDLESEGTQPEEDEDKNLSSEELSRKLEKLLRQSEQQLQQLAAGSHALRATCYGQDRYWRRYWSLGKCGGVFVEAMESAQPEILEYHEALEARAAGAAGGKRARERKPSEPSPQSEAQKKEAALKSELELKNIKSELNLSDHTQIIKYEPNVRGACKMEGSIKMEEKYIQHKQTNEEEMLDIEDSIPTAFLVQKPTHTPMFAAQPEAVDKPQEIVKVENVVKKEITEKAEPEESKDQLVNNLEELRKMAEAVSSQLDAAKKAEEIKEEKVIEPKKEIMEPGAAHSYLYKKMLEGKWFSILRHESSFLVPEDKDQKVYCDNEQTCSQVVMSQGHKWDVSNNLHLLNDPSLFTLNSMVTSVQVPSNNVYADSSMSMSGLDQDILDASKDGVLEVEEAGKEQDNDLEKELQADALKHDLASQKAKASSLTSLGLLNFNALSTYVTCDSPPPIQMTADEVQQLDKCKVHGLPKKKGGTFVPRELRHGWWRITEPEQLKELMDALHPRGARERELHASLSHNVPTVNNKLYIEKGDPSAAEFSISHLDRVYAAAGGYPPPEPPGAFCATTARRQDMLLLSMVEQLEERVAAASMQVKGWRPARLALPEEATGAEIVARARHKLASVEAHIERRYLKPPLVQSTTEATLGAVLQAEQARAPSPAPAPHPDADAKPETKGIARGLATWREAVARCNTSAQLAMLLQALEAATAWDKSCMKANCQFCMLGDNEDQLLLCDGCDKGYHTYCFKPVMDEIPEGDWYCWECVNKVRGDRVCIVCGGACGGRTIPCALCVRAYHQDCHYPPLPKNPRGKWYCSQCAARAPPRKRAAKRRDTKQKDLTTTNTNTNTNTNTTSADDQNMVPSPAPSHASTSTTAEEPPTDVHTPEKECEEPPSVPPLPPELTDDGPPPEKRRALFVGGNGAIQHDSDSADGPEQDAENVPLLSRAKKEKNNAKKLQKDLLFCKSLVREMESHEDSWPFQAPVNTKQFPQYKKIIKCPMDLSTVKKKLNDSVYKCKEEFASDVRLIFSNCEVFNEDDSLVGRAGHNMRQFFDSRWAQL